jgi:hypothetical protein
LVAERDCKSLGLQCNASRQTIAKPFVRANICTEGSNPSLSTNHLQLIKSTRKSVRPVEARF